MPIDILKCCRLCFRPKCVRLYEIFDEETETVDPTNAIQASIPDKIDYVLKHKVYADDDFSKLICNICLYELNKFYSFKKTFEEALQRCKTILKLQNPLVKPDDEVAIRLVPRSNHRRAEEIDPLALPDLDSQRLVSYSVDPSELSPAKKSKLSSWGKKNPAPSTSNEPNHSPATTITPSVRTTWTYTPSTSNEPNPSPATTITPAVRTTWTSTPSTSNEPNHSPAWSTSHFTGKKMNRSPATRITPGVHTTWTSTPLTSSKPNRSPPSCSAPQSHPRFALQTTQSSVSRSINSTLTSSLSAVKRPISSPSMSIVRMTQTTTSSMPTPQKTINPLVLEITPNVSTTLTSTPSISNKPLVPQITASVSMTQISHPIFSQKKRLSVPTREINWSVSTAQSPKLLTSNKPNTSHVVALTAKTRNRSLLPKVSSASTVLTSSELNHFPLMTTMPVSATETSASSQLELFKNYSCVKSSFEKIAVDRSEEDLLVTKKKKWIEQVVNHTEIREESGVNFPEDILIDIEINKSNSGEINKSSEIAENTSEEIELICSDANNSEDIGDIGENSYVKISESGWGGIVENNYELIDLSSEVNSDKTCGNSSEDRLPIIRSKDEKDTEQVENVHLGTSSKDHQFVFSESDKVFSQEGDLSQHSFTHMELPPFLCQFCAQPFTDTSCLVKHIRMNHPDSCLSCSVCKETFQDTAALETHKKQSHTKVINNYNISNSFVFNVDPSSGANLAVLTGKSCSANFSAPTDANFTCDLCAVKCASADELVEHTRMSHSNDVPSSEILCRVCYKHFPDEESIEAHKVVHCSAYTCPYCQDNFHSKKKFEKHMKVVHVDPSFKCGFCSSSFSSEESRKSHEVSHSTVRLGRSSKN